MRILLYRPPSLPSFWGQDGTRQVIYQGRKTAMAPLGLITIAGALPHSWKLSLLDGEITPVSAQHLRNVDALFVSAWSAHIPQMPYLVELTRACKVKLVVGGPGPTAAVEPFLKADLVHCGELGTEFYRLLSDLERGIFCEQVYRDQDRPALDELPMPRFDLLEPDCYITYCLQTSAGCPFACEFCEIPALMGKKQRWKTPARLEAELTTLANTGVRGEVFLADDNFVGNIVRTRELAETLLKWQQANGHPFTFSTEASLNVSNSPELLEIMAHAGFTSIFAGIETTEVSVLNKINKRHNYQRRSQEEAIALIQKKGIEVRAGLIVGFDDEPEDIAERLVEFLAETSIALTSINILAAPELAPLFRRMEQEGRIRAPVFIHSGFSPTTNISFPQGDEQVFKSWRRLWDGAYAPENVLKRIALQLERMPSVLSPRKGMGVIPSMRVLTLLGIFGEARAIFWRLIFAAIRKGRLRWVLQQCAFAWSGCWLRYGILAEASVQEREVLIS